MGKHVPHDGLRRKTYPAMRELRDCRNTAAIHADNWSQDLSRDAGIEGLPLGRTPRVRLHGRKTYPAMRELRVGPCTRHSARHGASQDLSRRTGIEGVPGMSSACRP